MTEGKKVLQKELKDKFGYDTFKSDLQERAVTAVYEGARNVFVSMPTGAGKSLCYQLPAVLFRGVTLVLSPLLALIENQVTQLQERGIKAMALNSKTTSHERKEILTDLHHKTPTIKLLYVTPELVARQHFRSELDTLCKFNKISLVAVDEVHCVSEWGHDFRPDYLKLGELRAALSDVPWLGLTATATPHVQKDVIKCLQMKHPVAVFKSNCFRSNLFYEIKFKDILKDPLQDLIEFVTMALKLPVKASSGPGSSKGGRGHSGCGIVYCRTRDGCGMLAGRLSSKGIRAKAYHAGLHATDRSEIQKQWMEGTVPVIVATISFGMGVDKSDVRFVTHWTMPKSMEAYYQESGRAGRDGRQAYCRIYYSKSDRDELVFLIKKEARKKKSKGYSASGHGTVKEATEKTFETLVKYCEEAQCRHSAIAEYFNDPKPQCQKSCDYCKNPTATKEHAKNGRFLSFKKSNRFGSVAGSFGKPDSSLYGGGRWGSKQDEGSDDSDEGSGRKRRGLFDDDFFETEFKKRRKAAPETEHETPSSNCRLKEASNFSRIPKLTLKVREYCLDQLLKALEQNAAQVGAHRDITEAAVDMEYSLFQTNKMAQTYKLNHNSKVKEIKSLTGQQILHSSLKDDEPLPHTQAPPTGTGGVPLFSGFMKASKLVSSEVVGGSSEGGVVGGFTPASCLLPSSVTNATSSLWSCDGAATHCGGGADGFESGDGERMESHSSMSSQISPNNIYKPPASAVVVKTVAKAIASPARSVPSCSPTRTVTKATPPVPSGSPTRTVTPPVPSGPPTKTVTKATPPGSPTRTVTPPVPSGPPTKTVTKAMPTPTRLRTVSKPKKQSDKRRKLVADAVVKALSSYYKEKRVSSKELFKKFAKKTAEHLMLSCGEESRGDLDREANTILQRYFSQFGQVKTEEDLKKLNQLS